MRSPVVERICGDCHLADDIELMQPVGLHWATAMVLYRHQTPGGCDWRRSLRAIPR